MACESNDKKGIYKAGLCFALVTEIQKLCSQIEHTLSIVDAIKGDALNESSVVTAVATNIDTVCNKLHESLDTLKKKIAIHDQNIKDTVKNIVELNQKAGAEEAVSLEGEEPNKLITHCKSMMALTKEYSLWLATIDPHSKSIAEKEFQLYIISQARIESVIVSPETYMTFEYAVQNLTANDAKFTAKSEQLINKINTAIEPLLERYQAAERDMTNILAEKNSLNFSWKKNMAALFSCQKSLEEDYKKIEVLFQNQTYLKPEVSVLVASLRRSNFLNY